MPREGTCATPERSLRHVALAKHLSGRLRVQCCLENDRCLFLATGTVRILSQHSFVLNEFQRLLSEPPI
jgi:hypothetical protein